jgi:hypothetical protein
MHHTAQYSIRPPHKRVQCAPTGAVELVKHVRDSGFHLTRLRSRVHTPYGDNMQTVHTTTMASQSIGPDDYDVIVIGSGMSGLACACILGKLGKRVLVLEQHDRPGGSLHTFQEHGTTFSSGNHYIGAFDEVARKLVEVCGSRVQSVDGPVETFIVDGDTVSYTPKTWNAVFQEDPRRIEKVADTMWWVAVVKLAPLWLAGLAWIFVKTVHWIAFLPYRDVVSSKWLRMQEGDVGCAPIAMVGAAVTRHYMSGLSRLSPRFVYDACRTIKKQGGRVVVNQTVSKVTPRGVISNGTFVPGRQIISSIGALQTCAIATLPEVQASAQAIGQSVEHTFVFLVVDTPVPPVVWIKEGDDYLFVSSDNNAVHLISETMNHDAMVQLFLKHYPMQVKHQSRATKYSVKKYLGRFASYGLACSAERFSSFTHVRALRPNTSMPNLFLTGQDVLMPGIVSALTTAMMTCRQVEAISLFHTLMQNDIMDRLSDNPDHENTR